MREIIIQIGCVGSLLRFGQGIHWQSLKAKRETIRILMISRLAVMHVMIHERSSTYTHDFHQLSNQARDLCYEYM